MPLDQTNTQTIQDDSLLLDAYSRAVISTVDRVGPAVVRVERLPDGNGQGGGGVGSGVVIAGDGLVLTNSHVVGGARTVRLTFADGSSREARMLGDDPDTDLALLRTDLISSWRQATPKDAPNRFVINVQPPQAETFQARLKAAGVRRRISR